MPKDDEDFDSGPTINRIEKSKTRPSLGNGVFTCDHTSFEALRDLQIYTRKLDSENDHGIR